MKHNNPKISVIIPVYNVEKYLDRCIKSILNQTLTDLEIIIINDGSTDSSLDIIKNYAKKDERIKVINQKNVGLSSTRNNGLKIAKSKYITFVDSDDFIENKKAYKKMLSTAEKYGSEIVIGNFNFINEKNEKWSRFNDYLFQDKNNFNKKSFLVNKTFFYDSLSQGVWNKLYKRSFLEKYNLKFPDGIIFEDTPFSLRAISLSKKISVIPDVVYDYYIGRKDSLSRKKGIKQLDFLKSSQLVKTNIHTLGLYKKYFPYFIWVILPLHQFKIIEQKYQKKFFDILNKNITKEDLKNILMYGNKEQIDFATALINNQYYKYILKEKILSFKNKIKDKTKRFLCKINPVYRYVSKIKDSNEQIIKSIDTINEKIDINKLIYRNFLDSESQIKSKLTYMEQVQNQINLKLELIQNKQNILEEKSNYLENLIKVSTDITKIPKATGNLRLVQKGDTLLLDKIVSICNKNNLNYWLSFGSLIGAVRHKGFVPWDDDLDISMMRSDYERLITILKKEFKNTKFTFVVSEIIRIYYDDTPLQVDIFPWDFYFKKIKTKKEKENLIKTISEQQQKIEYNWNNLFNQERVITNLTYEDIVNLKNKYVLHNRTVNPKNKPAIFRGLESPSTSKGLSEIFNYNEIFPLKEIKFENKIYKSPNQYQKILETEYGNPLEFPQNINGWHESIKNKLNSKTIKKIKKILKESKFD